VAGVAATSPDSLVQVFVGATVHFLPDSASKYLQAGQVAGDNGRIVQTTVDLPRFDDRRRITAFVTVSPIPKSDQEMFDRWDRAGNVRLRREGSPDLEIVRFMTAYGGQTEYAIDVTPLAPLLRGRCTLAAFVDTWTSPGWHVDFALRYEADPRADGPTWAEPVYYTDSFDREHMPRGVEIPVTIPAGLERVVLQYFATGHCTDGIDDDEFVSKANVLSVDGVVVGRFHPWREDCRNFRDRNPYTRHWTDGTWSSDYSRSGWCPGVEVLPFEFDLTDHLSAGKHVLRIAIEDMRPKDAGGQFGYWRVSAYLVGWDHSPDLWRNP